jgi:hypothetical protein
MPNSAGVSGGTSPTPDEHNVNALLDKGGACGSPGNRTSMHRDPSLAPAVKTVQGCPSHAPRWATCHGRVICGAPGRVGTEMGNEDSDDWFAETDEGRIEDDPHALATVAEATSNASEPRMGGSVGRIWRLFMSLARKRAGSAPPARGASWSIGASSDGPARCERRTPATIGSPS